MEHQISIQPAKAADLITIESLGREIWQECYGPLLPPGQIKYMLEKFQSAEAMRGQVQEQGYEYFLLQVAGKPAGYIGVQQQANKLLLSKLYLLAGHRGSGISTAMFSFVENLARQRALSHIWLTVNKGNHRAIRAYEKQGFSTLRAQVVEIGGGFVMDDYVMEKPVPQPPPEK